MEKNISKSMKLSSKDIIATRDKLCAQKTHDWKIIISENVMPKKAIANGLGARGKGIDLNSLYNSILQTGEKLERKSPNLAEVVAAIKAKKEAAAAAAAQNQQ